MVNCATSGCSNERHPSGRGYCKLCMKDKLDTASAGRGAGYGMDAALAAKAAAKYDKGLEAEVLAWIEAVSGERVAQPFMETLKDGVILCNLANACVPGAIKKVNVSKMPFKQMENITAFLKSARAAGVPPHNLFETVDLFEAKDPGLVVQSLFAYAGVVCNLPGYRGPRLGVKVAEKNVREFDEATLIAGRAVVSKQMEGKKMDFGKGMTNRDIGFGAKHAGVSTSNEVSRAITGKRMDHGAGVGGSHRDIGFGAKHAGASSSSETTKVTGGARINYGAGVSGGHRDIVKAGASSKSGATGPKFCPDCGAKNEGGKFCPECGGKF